MASMELVALTLLHILVFVYWLGGDLGAFYSSSLVADPKRSADARAAAANILMNVDMAPRAGLIFAFPTGLALAVSKGWLPGVGWLVVAAAFVAAAAWMALAVAIHVRHGPAGAALAGVDRLIRMAVAAALIGAGAAIVAGVLDAPLFFGLKLGLLGAAVVLGLLIRAALGPFGPAFGAMMATGATDETNAAIAGSLARVKPLVMLIWACLITAAALGVATPI